MFFALRAFTWSDTTVVFCFIEEYTSKISPMVGSNTEAYDSGVCIDGRGGGMQAPNISVAVCQCRLAGRVTGSPGRAYFLLPNMVPFV